MGSLLKISLIILFIFGILFISYPKIFVGNNGIFSNLKPHVQHITHPPVTISKPIEKIPCHDPRMASLNSHKKGPIGDANDADSLSSFYLPAKDHVPEDFPVKQIGECPYVKEQQHDIPIIDIPQCMADKPDYNMRINLAHMK